MTAVLAKLLGAMLAVLVVGSAVVVWRSVPGSQVDGGQTEILGIQVARADHAPLIPPGQGKKVFGISGDAEDLAPGVPRQLRLTLTNPNNFPIVVDSLDIKVGKPSRDGCAANDAVVSPYRGTRDVAANGSATTDLTITLRATAPDACKNATFPLSYAGTATKANQ